MKKFAVRLLRYEYIEGAGKTELVGEVVIPIMATDSNEADLFASDLLESMRNYDSAYAEEKV